MIVSSTKAEKFHQLIKENIPTWEEKTRVSCWKGIEKEDFEEFLETFRKTTPIDEQTAEALKLIKYSGEGKEQIKLFSIKQTEFSGTFGLIAMVKVKNKIDIMSVVFSFNVSIQPQWKFKPAYYIFKIPIYKFTRALDFDSIDLEELQENYIRHKALKSFRAEWKLKNADQYLK